MDLMDKRQKTFLALHYMNVFNNLNVGLAEPRWAKR